MRTNFFKELLRQVVPCTVTNIIIIVMNTIIIIVATITTIIIFVGIIVTIIIVTFRHYDFQPNLQDVLCSTRDNLPTQVTLITRHGMDRMSMNCFHVEEVYLHERTGAMHCE